MNFCNENDRKIYAEELRDLLPKKILDAHVHIWDQSFLNFSLDESDYRTRFGGTFTVDQWRAAMAEILPEQEVSMNCFGMTDVKIDRDISPVPDQKNIFSMALLSPADSAEDLRRRVERDHLIGVKPYLVFAADHYKKAANDVEIFDMFTPEQLEYLNEAALAVTLHIPRAARFEDPLNQRQMVEICRRYPRVKFIFAHIGRAYYMQNVCRSNLEELGELPNVYLDTAMINHAGVLRYAMEHFPRERILFGSDAPIALLRGKSVEINNQYAYLMGENYRIGTSMYDPDTTVKFTTFFYEQLRGMLDASEPEWRDDLFYNNAFQLFDSIARRYQ